MRSAALALMLTAVASLAAPAPSSAQLVPTGHPCDYTVGLDNALTLFDPDAADCLGAYEGNSTQHVDDILDIIESEWGLGDAEYLGSNDSAGNGPFSNFPEGGTGTLNFDTPLNGDYVLVLKTSTSFSLYLFEDLVDVASIYYTDWGVSVNCNRNGCSPRGLSHAELYGATSVSVPEPESAMLLLTGLLGLGFVAARRRREV